MSNGKNSLNSFYIEIGQDNLNKICTAIANVVNSRFNDIEISKVANTKDYTKTKKWAAPASWKQDPS